MRKTWLETGRVLRGRIAESLLVFGALALIAVFFWCGPNRANSAASARPGAAQDSVTPRIAQKRIADLRVGDRVLGENPEVTDAERANLIEPNPVTWRKLILQMTKEDGHSIDIELLRPLDHEDFIDALPGETIDLELHELGAAGEAKVVSIEDCPPIRSGPGNVVTGTFHHSATNLIDLQVQGETRPIGCTANHPFWSVDRNEFIPASELYVGEEVLSRTGLPTKVVATDHRPGLYPVYNLEVCGEHTYLVGENGILVHNSCTYNPKTQQGIYILYNKATKEIKYVGRGNVPARLAVHKLTKGKKSLESLTLFNNNLTKAQAKGIEQELIRLGGGAKKSNPGTNLLNEIWSYSKSNKNATTYKNAATSSLLGQAQQLIGANGLRW